MLPLKAIQEFKTIYRKRFGVTLSDSEAERRANNMMRLYRAILLLPRGSMHNVSESYERISKHK